MESVESRLPQLDMESGVRALSGKSRLTRLDLGVWSLNLESGLCVLTLSTESGLGVWNLDLEYRFQT